MHQDRIDNATHRLTELLIPILRAAPGSYDRVVLVEKQTGLVAETFVDLYSPDGTSQWVDFSSDGQAEADLHDACYSPGAGSWFSATITLHRNGIIETDFDYDQDPRSTKPHMSIPVSAAAIRREIECYPRDPDKWPLWFLGAARGFGVDVATQ